MMILRLKKFVGFLIIAIYILIVKDIPQLVNHTPPCEINPMRIPQVRSRN